MCHRFILDYLYIRKSVYKYIVKKTNVNALRYDVLVQFRPYIVVLQLDVFLMIAVCLFTFHELTHSFVTRSVKRTKTI